MSFLEFKKCFEEYLEKLNLELKDEQYQKFYNYMNLLIEWNKKINLTAITSEKEIIIKHFVDSLTILKYIPQEANIIDVGTGAGFPGIPLKIVKDDIKITLLYSLNKRIKFLDDVINKIELKNIRAIHGRAEEYAHNKEYREKFDIATSRAVANMSTLSEYLLPFVKIDGMVVAMKGSEINDEINKSKKAINVLGGNLIKIDNFNLPNSDYERNIILIKKEKNTIKKFPRKAGMPSKEPIV